MKRIEKVMEALVKNNMEAYYAERREDIAPIVKTLVSEGAAVAVSGSVSLSECGVTDMLRNGKYKFLDRHRPGLRQGEAEKIFMETFSADTYITCVDAVTENGELFSAEGNSERAAALSYGTKSVIVIIGRNKIVSNAKEAAIKTKAACTPKNLQNRACKALCNGKNCCASDDKLICCAYSAKMRCSHVILGYQQKKDRIKVVISGENMGF